MKANWSRMAGVMAGLATGLFAAQSAAAQTDNVVSSKHNMSARVGLTSYGEVCVYCHTPHGGQTSAPLWNRSFSVASYQMYDAAHSSTINMTVDPQPSGVALACLSCHDGTVGLDVIVNTPNNYTGGPAVGTRMPPNLLANLSTDLRNDHPISITYDPTADPQFRSASSVHAAGLQLYGGKVQCGSCHNPHTAANRPFLRISNAGSSLCLTCHIK